MLLLLVLLSSCCYCYWYCCYGWLVPVIFICYCWDCWVVVVIGIVFCLLLLLLSTGFCYCCLVDVYKRVKALGGFQGRPRQQLQHPPALLQSAQNITLAHICTFAQNITLAHFGTEYHSCTFVHILYAIQMIWCIKYRASHSVPYHIKHSTLRLQGDHLF